MNDLNVTKFTDIRFKTVDLDDVMKYWHQYNNSVDNPWFAICISNSNQHIGNIKLGPINRLHSIAPLSLFIGDRNSWGKGYATEAIRLVTDWAFTDLKLFKLFAYIYLENVGSLKAFKKAGFSLEGILKDEVFLSLGNRTDLHRVALTYDEWLKKLK